MAAPVAVVRAREREPVAVCAALWRQGAIVDRRGPVPRLHACPLDDGAVAVVPTGGRAACERSGIAELSGDELLELERLGSMRAALVERLGVACVGATEGARIARDELAAARLDGWSVVVAARFGARRPCAAVTVDRAARRLVLVGVSR